MRLTELDSKPKPATKDKAQPKPATADKAATDKKEGARRGRGKGGRGGAKGGSTRGKPKTAEELDQEMNDYWTPGDAAVANGGAVQPAATNGDAAMVDDIQ